MHSPSLTPLPGDCWPKPHLCALRAWGLLDPHEQSGQQVSQPASALVGCIPLGRWPLSVTSKRAPEGTAVTAWVAGRNSGSSEPCATIEERRQHASPSMCVRRPMTDSSVLQVALQSISSETGSLSTLGAWLDGLASEPQTVSTRSFLRGC